MHHVVDMVLQTCALVASGLVISILSAIARRLKLHISAQQEARLRFYVQSAIFGAEEVIESRVKNDAAVVATKARDKFAMAVTATMKKYPAMRYSVIEALIHEELGKLRGIQA